MTEPNITARIIADSISARGDRLTTFELEYPRIVHSEFMTHRQFSRNAASSRAIKTDSMLDLVMKNEGRPVSFGMDQAGMSAHKVANHETPIFLPDLPDEPFNAHTVWYLAKCSARNYARAFMDSGYHKQIANRLLEPFSMIKVVMTTTEYDNWDELRRHPDADPTIQRLAEKMHEAREATPPTLLDYGQWHVPYYFQGVWSPYREDDGVTRDENGHTLEDAQKISASCCAQVSYRRLNESLDKAIDIYKRLIESEPRHASPFEHQATPIVYGDLGLIPQRGLTHISVDPETLVLGDAWSGNLRGWIQYRHTLD